MQGERKGADRPHCRACSGPDAARLLLPASAAPSEPAGGVSVRKECVHEGLCLSVAFGWCALTCAACPLGADPVEIRCAFPSQAAIRRRKKSDRT